MVQNLLLLSCRNVLGMAFWTIHVPSTALLETALQVIACLAAGRTGRGIAGACVRKGLSIGRLEKVVITKGL